MPEAISKSVVDGANIPWEVVTPFKLQEITKFHVEVPAGMAKPGNSIFIFAMNQAKYDSLPAEYARWKKATDLVDDAWFKEAAAKGANGKALYDEAVALLKKYDK